MTALNIFWFRRDLRLDDNAGLYHAQQGGLPVLAVFIFDKNILDDLDDKNDRRVCFIYKSILNMQQQLDAAGSSLQVYYDTPLNAFKKLTKSFQINAVFTNDDYEPYARERDGQIAAYLKSHNIAFQRFKDHVIFEKDEVLKENNSPYHVFTPYSRKWKQQLDERALKARPSEKYLDHLYKQPSGKIPTLQAMGFTCAEEQFPEKSIPLKGIEDYEKYRNFPAVQGTTRLGVHLRFGTISIRRVAAIANELNQTFLNELIWREFFQMILWHYPRVVSESFKRDYDGIAWRNNEKEFAAWRRGETGFPIVDAGMRELNATGFMHNRVRMIAASFLTKLLLCDWRLGEGYFAEKLLDYELASNNGNWQWAAGSGCDAAPYFRIFNPDTQAEKFDPKKEYIKKWIPELNTSAYPEPIIDYKEARQRALKVYAEAVKHQALRNL